MTMQYSLDKVTQMGNHMDWFELLLNMDPSMRGTVAMGKGMDLEDGSMVVVSQELDGGVMVHSKVMLIIFIQMDLSGNQVGMKMVI